MAASEAGPLHCPLCPFQNADEYALNLHVEYVHFGPGGDAAVEGGNGVFQEQAEPSSTHGQLDRPVDVDNRQQNDYLPCPEPDCGEQFLLWQDLQEHLDFHLAEQLSLEDGGGGRYVWEVFPFAPVPSSLTCIELAPCMAITLALAHVPVVVITTTKAIRLCARTQFFHSFASMWPEQPTSIFRDYSEGWGWGQWHVYSCKDSETQLLPSAAGKAAIAAAVGAAESPLRERQSLARKTAGTGDENSVPERYPVTHRRLGTNELGPFAFEDCMPQELYDLLADDAPRITTQCIGHDGRLYRTAVIQNQVIGVVPLLGDLLDADNTVQRAWLCQGDVQHVFKLPLEGGFCGYRNTQMLLSFVLGAGMEGHEQLRQKMEDYTRRKGKKRRDEGELPRVLELQDWIEEAWDQGMNSWGRIETGGVLGTRKYIGTPEVQAMFTLLGIPSVTWSLSDRQRDEWAKPAPITSVTLDETGPKAHQQLFDAVERYFTDYYTSYNPHSIHSRPANIPTPSPWPNSPTTPRGHRYPDQHPKVIHTTRPPLYLQQPGHSVTIVGLEVRTNGERNLLLLDPGYKPSFGIQKLLKQRQNMAGTGNGNGNWRPGGRPWKKRKGNGGNGNAQRGGKSEEMVQGELKFGGGGMASRKRAASELSGEGSSGGLGSPSPVSSRNWGSRGGWDGWHGGPSGTQANKLLDAYRRGTDRLSRFREFEVLELRGQRCWGNGGEVVGAGADGDGGGLRERW